MPQHTGGNIVHFRDLADSKIFHGTLSFPERVQNVFSGARQPLALEFITQNEFSSCKTYFLRRVSANPLRQTAAYNSNTDNAVGHELQVVVHGFNDKV